MNDAHIIIIKEKRNKDPPKQIDSQQQGHHQWRQHPDLKKHSPKMTPPGANSSHPCTKLQEYYQERSLPGAADTTK
jgi:hypothetical protein